MPPKKSDRSISTSSPLEFEAKLWLAADKVRNNMDEAEYKHVVLDLISTIGLGDKESRTKGILVRRFDELTVPLMAKIKTNADQFLTLATLRDTLLPKLLSGDLGSAKMTPNERVIPNKIAFGIPQW